MWEVQKINIDGLDLPEEGSAVSDAENYSAIQLFFQRLPLDPSYLKVKEQIPSLIEICRLISGNPLCIELLAVQASSYHPYTNPIWLSDMLTDLIKSNK